MFDDIRLLEPGDEFVVWTLSEPYAYRVRDVYVIEPDELESLGIVRGKDLCSLVTCTPFGVNTHRLVVRGERCEYTGQEQTGFPATYVNRRTLPMLLGIGAIGGVAAVMVAMGRRRRSKSREGAVSPKTERETNV